MLKIKDNVDLKELENFGFIEYKLKTNFHKIIMFKSLIENKDNYAIISIADDKRLWCDFNKFDLLVFQKWNSILFDLIQAGLVEKVGE